MNRNPWHCTGTRIRTRNGETKAQALARVMQKLIQPSPGHEPVTAIRTSRVDTKK